MRRILLLAVLGTALAALPASALAKAKPPTIKTGTYKATTSGPSGSQKFSISLKRTKCTTTPGQGTPATHLCVALPISPSIQCRGAINAEAPLGSYATPVALSSTGKAVEHGTAVGGAPLPGAAPSSGPSSFSITFTKKGTASGYLELNLTIAAVGISTPCASGKVPFTAKLG